MNKIVLLGTFFLLFCMPATEPLLCFNCKRFQKQAGRFFCHIQKNSCTAGPGQKCFTTFVGNGKNKYQIHGCTTDVTECTQKSTECCERWDKCNGPFFLR